MGEESSIKNLAGYISLVLFILIENPFIKLGLAIFYILLSLINGMRIKILPNLILFVSITIINLFVPQGQILLKWHSITITRDALFSGIEKSSLLIGLMYLSKNITFSSIKIPGRAGYVIRDTFHYFNQLSSGERITKGDIIKQIDKKLLNLTSIKDGETINSSNNKKLLYIILLLTLIAFTLDKFLLSF